MDGWDRNTKRASGLALKLQAEPAEGASILF